MQINALRSTSPRTLAGGAALGAVGGFLAWHLGFLDIAPIAPPAETMMICAVVGMALSLAKIEAILVCVDLPLLALWLLVADTPGMAWRAARWVRDDGPIKAQVDAVVILSGAVHSDSSLNPEAVQRILTGLELMKARVAPRIVTSTVTADFGGREISSLSTQRRLIHLADADSAWSRVDSVHSTHDEAIRMASLLLPAGARSIAVVTSPMHTRRACATFEAVGFRVHCVAAGESDAVTWHPIQSEDRVAAFREYLYERLGMIKYREKGWVRPAGST